MQDHSFAFVVRIWLESTYSDGKSTIWRGSIEQVGNDCRIYFSDLDGMTQFIQTQIGLEPPPPSSKWRLALELVQDAVRKFRKRLLRRNP